MCACVCVCAGGGGGEGRRGVPAITAMLTMILIPKNTDGHLEEATHRVRRGHTDAPTPLQGAVGETHTQLTSHDAA